MTALQPLQNPHLLQNMQQLPPGWRTSGANAKVKPVRNALSEAILSDLAACNRALRTPERIDQPFNATALLGDDQ